MRTACWGVIAAIFAVLLIAAPAGTASPSQVKGFTAEEVEKADFQSAPQRSQASPLALKLQVWLARAHASPGAIDGVFGASTIQAIESFQAMQGMEVNGKLTREVWDRLREIAGTAPALKEYEIAKADVKGPFADKIPDDYKEKARLKRLAYTSPAEALAEKFHMKEAFLTALNRGKRLSEAGERITVVDTGANLEGRAERIEIDGSKNVLRAYGPEGKILATYPATIGSEDNPSPSGAMKVRSVARNPTYYYNPEKLNFAEVDSKEPLKIAAGPNNPVGAVWIDLDKDTYGIHGTSDPDTIGKTTSHGCVRLTNWDALELAGLVQKGTPVEFVNVKEAANR